MHFHCGQLRVGAAGVPGDDEEQTPELFRPTGEEAGIFAHHPRPEMARGALGALALQACFGGGQSGTYRPRMLP